MINPCKHPISKYIHIIFRLSFRECIKHIYMRVPTVILKDVSHTVMSDLLQFMYQGVVHVKHTEMNAFMKIAQALQIKGLATQAQMTVGKRTGLDFGNGGPSAKKPYKRVSDHHASHDMSGAESMENLSTDDVFLPHISMNESSRFDLSSVKRETGESSKSTVEYPNEMPAAGSGSGGTGNDVQGELNRRYVLRK